MRKRGHMRKTEAMINEIEKVIIGKREVIEQVLMTILAKGHVLLEDIPGVGKTTLALSFAKVMGVDYHRIQFTPDVTPSDVVGFSLYDRQSGEFQYKPGAVMCNLLLADEINRTSSKTQAALLEVMEEGNATVDGKTYEIPKPFTVIATQNPFGYSTTQLRSGTILSTGTAWHRTPVANRLEKSLKLSPHLLAALPISKRSLLMQRSKTLVLAGPGW